MSEKIKSIFKKNKVLVVIVALILILVVAILFTLFGGKEKGEDLDIKDSERESLITYYGNYKINLPDELIDRVDSYVAPYSVFRVEDRSHLPWAQKFVSATKGTALKYTEKPHPALSGNDFHTVDQTLHYWEDEENSITYENATDFLSFKFNPGVSIQGIQMNPQNRESMQNALREISTKFFSQEFSYEIEKIYRVGNSYQIEYYRLLDNLPVYNNTFLVVSPDGRLEEGVFLLAEFTKYTEFFPLSGIELRESLNQPEHSKSVGFDFVDLSTYDKFGEYGYSVTGTEVGEVELETVEFGYSYRDKFQEAVMPFFFLRGGGFVEIEGESLKANFTVEAN